MTPPQVAIIKGEVIYSPPEQWGNRGVIVTLRIAANCLVLVLMLMQCSYTPHLTQGRQQSYSLALYEEQCLFCVPTNTADHCSLPCC